jgi:hypothetical protein
MSAPAPSKQRRRAEFDELCRRIREARQRWERRGGEAWCLYLGRHERGVLLTHAQTTPYFAPAVIGERAQWEGMSIYQVDAMNHLDVGGTP